MLDLPKLLPGSFKSGQLVCPEARKVCPTLGCAGGCANGYCWEVRCLAGLLQPGCCVHCMLNPSVALMVADSQCAPLRRAAACLCGMLLLYGMLLVLMPSVVHKAAVTPKKLLHLDSQLDTWCVLCPAILGLFPCCRAAATATWSLQARAAASPWCPACGLVGPPHPTGGYPLAKRLRHWPLLCLGCATPAASSSGSQHYMLCRRAPAAGITQGVCDMLLELQGVFVAWSVQRPG